MDPHLDKPFEQHQSADGVEPRDVEAQLTRILENRLFKNSERYSRFLRYVVEARLRGDSVALKERLIGISVFSRDASYDTVLDNVVRISAAEVRKKLAQYYEQPEHQVELRISLSRGSYVPHFSKTFARPNYIRAGHLSGSFLDDFWGPVIDSPNSAMIVVGPSRRN